MANSSCPTRAAAVWPTPPRDRPTRWCPPTRQTTRPPRASGGGSRPPTASRATARPADCVSRQTWPPCRSCARLRRQIEPVWPSCKEQRLCSLLDPGVIQLSPSRRFEELQRATRSVYDGHTNANRLISLERFPLDSVAFLSLLRRVHYLIFQEAFPTFAGRFRGLGEGVEFGGDGANRLEGAAARDIEARLKGSSGPPHCTTDL